MGRYAEQRADGGELGHGSERLLVVDARLLREAFGHEAHLVAVDGAVGLALDLEDPLAADGLTACWQGCQRPRAGLLDGVHLVLRCLLPLVAVRTAHGLGEGSGFLGMVELSDGGENRDGGVGWHLPVTDECVEGGQRQVRLVVLGFCLRLDVPRPAGRVVTC